MESINHSLLNLLSHWCVGVGGGLVAEIKLLKEMQEHCGVRKSLNSEFTSCGGLVYYFPQGHSEQVAASTRRTATSQIPNYPNLPSQLLCQVQNVTLHADKETDEIYAQMTLQPLNSDYTIQPPTQELVVRYLHDNTWTDEKSQLRVGVRRANRQQTTTLPSSVLSADSMHIGILAAAAHAAANQSPFTIFYNPRHAS
ncbi:hypothetical protein RYX36_019423 [Vicia faba]